MREWREGEDPNPRIIEDLVVGFCPNKDEKLSTNKE